MLPRRCCFSIRIRVREQMISMPWWAPILRVISIQNQSLQLQPILLRSRCHCVFFLYGGAVLQRAEGFVASNYNLVIWFEAVGDLNVRGAGDAGLHFDEL